MHPTENPETDKPHPNYYAGKLAPGLIPNSLLTGEQSAPTIPPPQKFFCEGVKENMPVVRGLNKAIDMVSELADRNPYVRGPFLISTLQEWKKALEKEKNDFVKTPEAHRTPFNKPEGSSHIVTLLDRALVTPAESGKYLDASQRGMLEEFKKTISTFAVDACRSHEIAQSVSTRL